MTEQFPTLKKGVSEYPAWRDWWHTEIYVGPEGGRIKMIPVGEQYIDAALAGQHDATILAVPVCIAMTKDRQKLRVWPTPDRDYETWLPEPLIPNSPYAGRYVRKDK